MNLELQVLQFVVLPVQQVQWLFDLNYLINFLLLEHLMVLHLN